MPLYNARMRYTPLRVMEAVNEAFRRIPREEIRALLSRRDPIGLKSGMSMFTSAGKPRLIDVQMRPWGMDAVQRRFFYRTCRLLKSALDQVMPLYLANPQVREILPLESKERQWILEVNARRIQRPQAVMDRLDATATFACSDWKENFWFLEPNSVGIGGIHYIRGTCEMTHKWVLPLLKRYLPEVSFVYPDDIRTLLLKLMARHARAIGRRLRRVAFVEDQSACEGTDEFTTVARQFRRWGLPAITGDPREVTVRRGELTVKGQSVDLLYRDTELTELFEMTRRQPARREGMKQAFLRNQVISSIAGEFDHKSVWELFTNPEFARHFTLRQRRLFRKHLLWTRLLWPRRTTDPKGREIDLAAYTRRNRESLLLKPNRMYGGEGVLFGHQITQPVWERHLDQALRRPSTHVIQQTAQVRAELFPVATRDGRVRLEPLYVVTGFAATRDGLAVLGRASRESVVNVSRRGGLIALWLLG